MLSRGRRLVVLEGNVFCLRVGESWNALYISTAHQQAKGIALNINAIAWPCSPSFSGKAADVDSEYSEVQMGKIMNWIGSLMELLMGFVFK